MIIPQVKKKLPLTQLGSFRVRIEPMKNTTSGFVSTDRHHPPLPNLGTAPEEVSRNRILKYSLIAFSQGHPLSDTLTSQHN